MSKRALSEAWEQRSHQRQHLPSPAEQAAEQLRRIREKAAQARAQAVASKGNIIQAPAEQRSPSREGEALASIQRLHCELQRDLQRDGSTALDVCNVLQKLAQVRIHAIGGDQLARQKFLAQLGVAKTVGRLRKHRDADVSEMASAIVKRWKIACGLEQSPDGAAESPRSPARKAARSAPAGESVPAAATVVVPEGPKQAPAAEPAATAPPAAVMREEAEQQQLAVALAAEPAAQPPVVAEPLPAEPESPVGYAADSFDSAAPTVEDLVAQLAAKCPAKGKQAKRLADLTPGSLVFGACLFSGTRPSLGDYGLGLVTRVPTPLDDDYELRALWRDPLDGESLEVRDAVTFGKHRMTEHRILKLAEEEEEGEGEAQHGEGRRPRLLPRHYTRDDIALLARGRGSQGAPAAITAEHEAALADAGFALVRARGLGR